MKKIIYSILGLVIIVIIIVIFNWQLEQTVLDVKEMSFAVDDQSLTIFGEPVYGDLNHDGDDNDAALWLVSDSAGSGTFYYAALVMNTRIYNGKTFEPTNVLFFGDRIAPQTLEIHNGQAVYNFAERRPSEPMTTSPSIGKSVWIDFDAKSNKITVDRHLE